MSAECNTFGFDWRNHMTKDLRTDRNQTSVSWSWNWSWNLLSWSWSWSWYSGNLPELELELKLPELELELELKLSWVGVGVEILSTFLLFMYYLKHMTLKTGSITLCLIIRQSAVLQALIPFLKFWSIRIMIIVCSTSLMASLIRSVGGLSKCFYQGLWLAVLSADVIGQSINRRGVA